ncbi:MAG: hypothetical protein E4H03_11775, partial [Myxococcales bacterium]
MAGTTTSSAGDGAQAIDRAARVLVRLVESDDVVTLTSLMEDTQLPKSTAARVLRALERNGLAQRRRGGGFRPGPVLVEYARRDSSVGDLATLAWPFLEQLGQLTGETVNVAIPTPGGVARVAQVDSSHPLGAGNWVGSRIPIHASSMGKVFMAFGAAQPPFGRLAKLGPNTITDLSALLTGLLLGLTLPPRLPWWMPLIGGIVAIALGKQVFGGLGHNIFNPALVGRAVLFVSWSKYMTTSYLVDPGAAVVNNLTVKGINAVTGATPLAAQGLVRKDELTISATRYYKPLLLGNP